MTANDVDRREAVRLAGRVREVSAPPPATWVVRLGDRTERRTDGAWLTLDVDGATVRVETGGAWLVGDGTPFAGAWRDANARAGDRFDASLAPTFAAAQLTTVEIRPGDAAEVYGEVVERGFEDDGALREAPTTTVRRVQGLVIARGANASADLDRAIARRYPPAKRPAKAPPRPDPRARDPGSPLHRPPLAAWAFPAVFLGFAVLALILRAQPVAVGMVAAALMARPSRTSRVFRARDERERGGASILSTMLAPMLYVGTVGGLLGVGNHLAYEIATWVFVALAIVVEGLLHASVRWHRTLATGAPWTGAVGVRARISGVVRDPTPIAIGKAGSAIARETAYDKGIGSNPDTVKWTRFHADGTFLVESQEGVVEVHPDEIIWASTVVDGPDDPSFDYEMVERIPIGGKVAAVGWIEPGAAGAPPRLRAKGTTPAVLLATSPLGDPVGLAREFVKERRITRAGLALAAAALVILRL